MRAGSAPDRPAARAGRELFTVGDKRVRTFLNDGKVMWVGTSAGVIRHNTETREHQLYSTQNSALLSDGVLSLDKLRGRLWVGTYGGGLSIYDGKAWASYNIPEGLADPFVYAVAEDRDGDIWIATWSGANRVVGGKLDDPEAWETHTVDSTQGGLPNDWVYSIEAAPNGVLWFATEGGLARYDGGRWRHWNHEDGLGAPYARVEQHLETVEPGQVSRHHGWQENEAGDQGSGGKARSRIAYNPDYIVAMLLDSKGRVLCGTWGGGLSILEDGKFKTYTAADGLAGNYVTALGEAPDGTIWVGTSTGLTRVGGGSLRKRFVNYTHADGLYGDFVFSLAFDAHGALWVGGIGGAVRFPDGLS